jgi:A/G-specific adenine glycosylase
MEAVRRLPGIGRYTAGAILSIAFDLRTPILEANTIRLFSRLLAYRGEPTSPGGLRLLWAAAEAVLPRRGCGQFNQALMELGSLVCTPRTPGCAECPAAGLCRARAEGAEQEIPHRKAKRQAEECQEAALVVYRRGRVLLRKPPEGERWSGLWDFPRFPIQADEGRLEHELAEGLFRLAGIRAEIGPHLTTLRHGVTRFRITLRCYRAEYRSGATKDGASDGACWAKPEELADYPLSTTGRKIAKLVQGL